MWGAGKIGGKGYLSRVAGWKGGPSPIPIPTPRSGASSPLSSSSKKTIHLRLFSKLHPFDRAVTKKTPQPSATDDLRLWAEG